MAASNPAAAERTVAAVPIEFEVTRHAALRYGERVRGAVHGQVARARVEIGRLVRAGVRQADPPPWLLDDVGRYEAGREYILLGPDVAFVVLPGQGPGGRVTRVITVMTPWDEGACHRAARRDRRAERWRRQHPPHPPHLGPRRHDDGGRHEAEGAVLEVDDRLAAD